MTEGQAQSCREVSDEFHRLAYRRRHRRMARLDIHEQDARRDHERHRGHRRRVYRRLGGVVVNELRWLHRLGHRGRGDPALDRGQAEEGLSLRTPCEFRCAT